MNDEQLKLLIGSNIAMHRKRIGLTQAGLAAKLNYSDKAVSKWERGESTPDVITLMQLADLFEVQVNDLLSDPNALPEDNDPGKLEQVMSQVSEKALKRKANKNVILGLSSTLVWFVALLIFVLISSFDIPHSWVAFLYAVPVNAIVALSLRSAWRDFRWNRWLISAIVWGFLLSIHVSLVVFFRFNMWKMFLLGVPGEIATTLWFRLFSSGREDRKAEHAKQ